MKTAYTISLAALCLVSAACSKSEKKNDSSLQTVEVALPTVDSVLIHQTYPGTLTANREVELVGRVDGYLTAKTYQGGDFVKEGKALFKIEDTNYRDALAQAQATLATAQANREYAAKRYAAMAEALKGDAVSEMEVAEAKSTLEQCEADIKNATAAVQTAQTQLSYCTVCAPFDGHIDSGALDVGAYVAGSGSPVLLAKIYEDFKMVAHFSIDDSEALGKLKANLTSGDISFKTIPINFAEPLKHSYTGDLTYMAPQVDTSTGTLQLQAMIQNPYNELRSGMYVSVDLPVDAEPHAILIKDASIASDQLGKYVYVVNDSNKVVYTPIKTGELVRDTMRIVTSGLTPESRYVTKALLKVRDGMEVKPELAK